MRQLMEAAVMAAALGLMTAALVNFSDGALVHAVFWAVLAVAALLVFFVLRVEELLNKLNRRNQVDEYAEVLAEEIRDMQRQDLGSQDLGSQDWGDVDWTDRRS